MNQLFQIGDVTFRIVWEDAPVIPVNFARFAVDSGEAEYTYYVRFQPQLPPVPESLTAVRHNLAVSVQQGRESRWLAMPGLDRPFAWYGEKDDCTAEILIDPASAGSLEIDPIFTGLFALERRLAEKNNLILHCAYTRYQGQAILFSAPSETGKTTQANLWQQYRGSAVVNGDRCLLRRIDGGWYACGWPVCGTSGICRNEVTPVRAIVMLSRGKTDIAERMSGLRAFSQLYSQITVNGWNPAAVSGAMDTVSALIGEVPVLHLACTISENAVDCLDAALQSL